MAPQPKGFGVVMIRRDLAGIPQFALPEPFSFRWYQPGDEAHWLDIHERADKLQTFEPETFERQFGRDVEVLRRRQCYLCRGDGLPVGTATAWFEDDYAGLPHGRVHWVAILPAFQGRGLAKPLMTTVCNRLRRLGHVRAYLTTNTARVPAIGLYLKFNFVPLIRHPADRAAWRAARQELPETPLASMDLGAG